MYDAGDAIARPGKEIEGGVSHAGQDNCATESLIRVDKHAEV